MLSQLLAEDENLRRQLLLPQVRLPAHSKSLSQSPSPTLHGLELEQQLQSILGIPLHLPGGDVVSEVLGVVKAPNNSRANHVKKLY